MANKRTIVMKEGQKDHEKYYIPIDFSDESKQDQSNNRQLTKAEYKLLESHLISEKVQYSSNKQRFSIVNYVGIIELPTVTIEILPKISLAISEKGSEEDSNQSSSLEFSDERKILIQMIKNSKYFKLKNNYISEIDEKKTPIYEMFTYLLVKDLKVELLRGPYMTYNDMVENISTVRGKIVVKEQFKNKFKRNCKIACNFDEFTVDNKFNRLIKFGLKELLKKVSVLEVKKHLNFCINYLDEVKDCHFNISEFKNFVFNRQNQRFKVCFETIGILLNGNSPIGTESTKNTSYSILIEMNKLYERYIYEALKSIEEECKVEYQEQLELLTYTESKSNKKKIVSPDFIVSKGKEDKKIIIDTKWKDSEKQSLSDIYQMIGYLFSIETITNELESKAATALLLYPYSEESDNKANGSELIEKKSYVGIHESKKIGLAKIDCSDYKNTKEGLKEILDSIDKD